MLSRRIEQRSSPAPAPASADTIAAIATAPGQAGISIVRISGPESWAVAERLFAGSGPRLTQRAAGTFHYGAVCSPGDAAKRCLDEVILLLFKAPHSYTREDVVEIQGHGGRTCAARILRAALDAGARLAEAGEFTKRAFLNGRIDLLQAEAVADLVAAKSERAAAAAIEQLDGHLTSLFTDSYNVGMNIAADLEATLDFDEGELPPAVMAELACRLTEFKESLERIIATWGEGRLLREGARVVICGQPNVGKSTLLNKLLGTDRAIVTDIPGTTRDTIEEELLIDGVAIRLTDTAGLREVHCDIERQGVERARQSIERADVVLYVLDASQPLQAEDGALIQSVGKAPCLLILNKCDLGQKLTPRDLPSLATVVCSALAGTGLDNIRREISRFLGLHASAPPHAVISERHRSLVGAALERTREAAQHVASGREEQTVLAANALRVALKDLGAVTGVFYDEDLLNRIFGRFCIGK